MSGLFLIYSKFWLSRTSFHRSSERLDQQKRDSSFSGALDWKVSISLWPLLWFMLGFNYESFPFLFFYFFCVFSSYLFIYVWNYIALGNWNWNWLYIEPSYISIVYTQWKPENLAGRNWNWILVSELCCRELVVIFMSVCFDFEVIIDSFYLFH